MKGERALLPAPAANVRIVRRILPIASLVACVLSAIVVMTAISHKTAVLEAPTIDSVAVLPFLNESKDSAFDYLSEGFAESLIGDLSQLRSLRVMALGTTLGFKGRTIDPRTAGRQLQVAAVLQGRMRIDGETLNVDADLVNTATGVMVWAGRYRRRFALPYIGLSNTYQVMDDWTAAPRDVVPKAKAAAEKALELDPTLSGAHTALAAIQFWYEFDQVSAEQEFQRAIELDPASDDAQGLYGWFLVSHGRCDEGLVHNRRALELSPLDPEDRFLLAQSLYFCRHNDEASQVLHVSLERDQDSWLTHEFLGWTFEQKGYMADSIAELKRSVSLEASIAEPLASLGRAHALKGDRRSAFGVLRQIQVFATHHHVPPYDLALVYLALSEKQKAIAEVQAAWNERSWFITFLALDPRMDPIRSDGRVKQILQEAQLQ